VKTLKKKGEDFKKKGEDFKKRLKTSAADQQHEARRQAPHEAPR